MIKLYRSVFIALNSMTLLFLCSFSIQALENTDNQNKRNINEGTTDNPIVLEKGVEQTDLSGLQGKITYFLLSLTADTSDLKFRISGGSGDADLYIRYDQIPTTDTFDCRPYQNGNNEVCHIKNAMAGNYYVMVRGYSSYTKLNLVADFNDGTDPMPAPPVEPPPSPELPIAGACMNAVQQDILNAHNAARAEGRSCGGQFFAAASPLQWNCQLAQAATNHTQDMAINGFLNHTGSNGSSVSQRLDVVGYNWQTWAENIAAGQNSVNDVMQGWLNSPGHCSNIMNPNVTEIGSSRQESTAGQYPIYWTTVFGRLQ